MAGAGVGVGLTCRGFWLGSRVSLALVVPNVGVAGCSEAGVMRAGDQAGVGWLMFKRLGGFWCWEWVFKYPWCRW